MSLVFAAITPHPPIIIPGVGSRADLIQARATTKAMEKLASAWKEAKPASTIIISPHAPLGDNSFAVNNNPRLKTNLTEFGAAISDYEVPCDTKLINQLSNQTGSKNLLATYQNSLLDHGTSVPLYYFLRENTNQSILSLGFSALSLAKHFEFGRIIAETILNSDKNIAVIASGDLSHALSPKAPAGLAPQGKIFDDYVIRTIKENKLPELVNTEKSLIAAAAECGLRSFVILAGILAKFSYKSEIISYEAPWGVGYLVANFNI